MLRKQIAGVLRRSPKMHEIASRLYWSPFLSRLYYGLDRRFRTLSPGAPGAISDALAKSRVDGDYYEFGLFRGYTFWHAQRAANRLGLMRTRFWGFDSFEGLPEPAGPDRDASFFAGQFACSRERVVRNLEKHGGVDWGRTELIQGFFEDVLTDDLRARHAFGPVRVAFIDCDLWRATCAVLDWLAPLIRPGTIILFDDWRGFGAREDVGQPLAFGEFLAANPDWQAAPFNEFADHGKGFVMDAARAWPARSMPPQMGVASLGERPTARSASS